MGGNEIANLAQNGELATRWLNCFVIHACRVAGSTQQADAFFGFFLIFLWDGCAENILTFLLKSHLYVVLCHCGRRAGASAL